ncbi:matrixin family metalloprotease [Streptomyces spororaveus]|uniref:matrixin family metalloprotease n=1 Tax=Streptomyces spororaveus TaxID=284039 RepID=UPI003692DB72
MTDVPVPGDYDGDGALDTAFWRPADGSWFIQPSSGGQERVVQFGRDGDIPVPNDFDHDRKQDLAIWRPSDRTLRVRPSSGQPDWALSTPQDGEVLRPDDYDALTLFAYALFDQTPRLEAAGRRDEALAAARESIRVFVRLAASTGDLSPASYLARVMELADHLPASEAVAPTQDAVTIQRRLIAAAPANLDHQADLANALFWLALRLKAAGRPEEAPTAARESIRVFLRLAAIPGALYPAAFLSRVVQLADHLPASEAVVPTQEAATMLRSLADTDPANLDYQVQLASTLQTLTRFLRAADRPAEAATASAEAEMASHRAAALKTAPPLLESLGYGVTGDTATTELLRRYGIVWNLPLDGQPFSDQLATVAEHLDGRFCVLPDHPDNHGGLAIRTAGPVGEEGYWPRGNLTWSVDSGRSSLDATVIQTKISEAFSEWVKAMPKGGFFSFRRVESDGDIKFHFVRDVDGFTVKPDWEGDAEPPPIGEVRFNGFISEPGELFRVALHEIGHALGLAHSDNKDSVMYPYIPSKYVIDEESRRALTDLYQWTAQALSGGATANRPSLAVTKNSYSDIGRLIMAWRGSDEDSLWWSEFGGLSWSSQEQTPGFGSTHGPALTSFPYTDNLGGFYMAWKGARKPSGGDDSGIWYASKLPGDPEWGSQQLVPNVGTSCGPTIAWFNNRLHLAWKGRDEDRTIWHSSLGPQGWEPQQKVSIKTLWTSHSPCLVTFGQRLYLFFRSSFNSNVAYTWLDSAPGSVWQDTRMVQYATFERDKTGKAMTSGLHLIGTSHGPAATVHGNLITLAWKGVEGDSGLWFAHFDGKDFSGQVPIPERATSEGPAIASWGGRLHMAWKGGHETDIFYSTLFD